MTNLSRSLVLGCSVVALAACGPENLGSPGATGDVNVEINDNSVTNPAPTSTGTPTPTPSVTPASDCPTVGNAVLTNAGTITNPSLGTWRVCEFPSVIDENGTVPYIPGVIYALPGRVDIGTDDGPTGDASDGITGNTVTLNIDAGVVIYGATGRSYLIANRGSQLNVNGTVDRPVVFTSRNNVLGAVSNSSSQQWGGVVLLGRAPVSDCITGANPANQLDCQQELEGEAIPTLFGGNTPGDDSGDLEYFQIRYSGFTLASGSELQSLTTGGVGSGTGFSFFQSYNSSDDGMEFFGGAPKMDHSIVVGAEDDSYDIDTGAKADLQYAIVVQRDGIGDNSLELDSPNSDFDFTAIPRTNAKFTNFTFIDRSGSQALRVRGRADLNMSNGIVVSDGNCLRVDEEDGAAAGSRADEAGPIVFNSVLFDCDSVDDNSRNDVNNFFGAGNQENYASTLTNLFVNTAAEDGYTPIFDATTVSSFFETTTFVGAASSTDTWFQGWTCDSATIDFGSGESCQSIPVYN